MNTRTFRGNTNTASPGFGFRWEGTGRRHGAWRRPVANSAAPKERAAASGEAGDTFDTLDEAMRQHIEAALSRTGGRIEGSRGAAKLLKINPHTLRARMRKLRIQWDQFRS